jgi:PPOX class probable F420-dependent enzyme
MPVRSRAVADGMTSTLPDFARDLLDRPTYATVASLERDGAPQLSVVWVKRDGDDVLFSTLADRHKTRNWQRDPRASLLAFDPEDPERYVELRGRVTVVDDPGGSLIHELAEKYTGGSYTGPTDGRVIVRLSAERLVTH